MKIKTIRCTSKYFFIGILICILGIPNVQAKDVTPSVENLGNPFSKGNYANNVWDMKVFDGRIYLGHGNSSNKGPNQNAGPIPIISLNPETCEFSNEYTVDEEQIDIYRIIGGELVISGHDPREDWSKGNFYRLEQGDWIKYRTIPDGIHTYDMYEFAGKIYAALGTANKPAIIVSSDNGLNWSHATNTGGSRAHCLFELNGDLYASFRGNSFQRLKGQKFSRFKVRRCKVFPGVPGWWVYSRISRPVNFMSSLVYIGAIIVNDHQWDPFGLYMAKSLKNAKRVDLPNDSKPWDILVRDSLLYVLLSQKVEGNPDRFLIVVLVTKDLRKWEELFRFAQPTFARSFEQVDRDFYFGLGTSTKDTRPEAGTILRVRKGAYHFNPSFSMKWNLNKWGLLLTP